VVSADWQENSKENFKASLKSFWVFMGADLQIRKSFKNMVLDHIFG